SAGVLGAVQAVCSALGLQLNVISVRDGTEIDHAFSALAHELDTGFIVLPGPTSTTNYERFIALAARHRIPAIYPYRYIVSAGGLSAILPETPEGERQAASDVFPLLPGGKPHDPPR